MHLKRLSAAALSLSLAASLTAFAAELPQPESVVDVPIPARYTARLTVNGKALEPITFENVDPVTYEVTQVTMSMEDIPGAPTGYIPMRILCAADPKGYADWIPAEDSAVFSFRGNSFVVHFGDMSVEASPGEVVEGVKAYLSQGVTFLPASFLATLEGVTVDDHPEMSSEHYDISFYVDPVLTLCDAVAEGAGMAAGMELTSDIFEMYGMDLANFESISGYMPLMNTQADTVVIGKYAETADKAAAKADLEKLKAAQMQAFEHYLPDVYEVAKAGQIAESEDGAWVMLIISEDNDAAIQLFRQGVAGL